MKIIGIDPGYERVGIAVIDKPAQGKDILLYSSCFKTKASLPFQERLVLIGTEIERVVAEYTPTHLAIETLLFNTNKTTALKVSEARGVIIFSAIKNGLTYHEYTPLQIKAALTGYGRATKDQVDIMTRNLIVIEKDISTDDEMDAIAIAITCSASNTHAEIGN